jgi:carbamoyl-phosphate synthase large subunit
MRILLLGAGGNAANNVARCLWAAGHYTVGADADPLMLRLSDCDRTVVLETLPADGQAHLDELQALVEHHGIGFLHAQPDAEARFVAEHRRGHHGLRCPVAVPPAAIVARCQDKLACAEALGGLAPATHALADGPAAVARALRRHGAVWLRLRHGSGSTGALPTGSAAMAEQWVAHWSARRGFGWEDWIAAEVLPGRDLSWTGLYSYGRLVLSVAKERERLLGGQRSPAGVSSTATIQRIVRRPDLNAVCEEAVRRVAGDELPHGVLMVDAREDANGRPRVTEINAGRFGTTVDFFQQTGPCLVDLLVEIGTGAYEGPYERRDEHSVGALQVRNTDCLPRVLEPGGVESAGRAGAAPRCA